MADPRDPTIRWKRIDSDGEGVEADASALSEILELREDLLCVERSAACKFNRNRLTRIQVSLLGSRQWSVRR